MAPAATNALDLSSGEKKKKKQKRKKKKGKKSKEKDKVGDKDSALERMTAAGAPPVMACFFPWLPATRSRKDSQAAREETRV